MVILRANYREKADKAIGKNFNQSQVKTKKIKAFALQRCSRLELAQMKKLISTTKKDHLDMFFSAKTHKEGFPFRVLVTEKLFWQGVMSGFLLRHLFNLKLGDPFFISNSEEVTQYLLQNTSKVGFWFSFDVEDLFYSIPHTKLFAAVNECIEANEITSFQNECGIQMESFLELLQFYLSATAVKYKDPYYLQKKGILFGSCVAPILCDIPSVIRQ